MCCLIKKNSFVISNLSFRTIWLKKSHCLFLTPGSFSCYNRNLLWNHRTSLKTQPAHSRGWSVLSIDKLSINWNLFCVPDRSKLSVGWQNKSFVSISSYEILNWENNLFTIFLLSKNTGRCTREDRLIISITTDELIRKICAVHWKYSPQKGGKRLLDLYIRFLYLFISCSVVESESQRRI